MSPDRPRERWLTRAAALVAAALGATLLATPQASARPPFPEGPFRLVNEAYNACLTAAAPGASRPVLGGCEGPAALWLQDENGLEELRNFATGQCLTRAARFDDCARAGSDPQRFITRAVQVGEESFEILFPYSGDTAYYLQAKPEGPPTVTTSTQRPGHPLLGFWRFR
ncbi:hypothetical protein [Streptomyces sp. TRM64462]|uniref:hypothetical protein n=1 Tax=Streptomyces sp. TRM64462 TaxID=2741726 RepID=UPI001586A482|nr:hypothetical protein [Streptomyces sp. TRM64462]